MDDTNSLSHTSYRCKYHIVIVPKYRRMIIYNKLRQDIGQILRTLVERKPGCKLLEAEACPDHIHMLIEIPPKYAVADFMAVNVNVKVTKNVTCKFTSFVTLN